MSHEIKKFIPDNLRPDYSEEVIKLLTRLEVSPTLYLSEGTINHGWLARNEQTATNQILVIGPAIEGNTLLSTKDSGYLDTGKFTKAKKITDQLLDAGIPAIKFFAEGTGRSGNMVFSWGLEEVASGMPLSQVWDSLSDKERLILVEQVGAQMANYQQIKTVEDIKTPETSHSWYVNRMSELLIDGLNMAIFDQTEADRIMNAFQKILSISKPNDTIGLIHGDLFPANIFVEKNRGTYEITNIIDWETATIGHTGYEQVLTAWWLSGEKGGDKEIFEAIVNSSTARGNNKGFNDENLRSAVALVDLFWHVNVIVSCTALGKMINVPRWIKSLNEIISLIESNKPYAVFSEEQ